MGHLNCNNENSLINQALPISLVKDKVYLFSGKEEEVDYSLYTDGNIEHLDTWLDDRAYQLDLFLEGCGRVRRLEFNITDAKVLLIEKRRKNEVIKNFYVDLDNINKIVLKDIYKTSVNDKGHLKIKKVGLFNGN